VIVLYFDIYIILLRNSWLVCYTLQRVECPMHFLRGVWHCDISSTWTNMCGVLYDDLLPIIFFFFFFFSPLFSILSSKFALAIQTFTIVFSFIDISILVIIFLFIVFVLGPFVNFFFFNLIIGSIIIICYFFQIQTSFF